MTETVSQRAAECAEEVVSASNIVTCGGFYEADIESVTKVIATFEREIVAEKDAEIERLRELLARALAYLPSTLGVTRDIRAALATEKESG